MADESKACVPAEPVKITRSAKDCLVDTVTVFVDRAEVTRNVKLHFDAPGDYEVEVEGLTSRIDADSVRVNGTGNVVLREVNYAVHHKPVVKLEVTDETATSPAVIRQERDKLQAEVEVLKTRQGEINRSKELLTRYTDTMISAQPREGSADVLAASMEFAFALLERQQAKAQEYHDQLEDLRRQIEAKQKLVAVANSRLAQAGQSRSSTTVKSHDVTVVVQATEAGEADLCLVYMVNGASWTPAYDARITSTDTTVALTYYGMVKQNTGESWANTRLVLSTATPSVGGTAPVLPTKHVGFFDPTVRSYGRNAVSASSASVHRYQRRGGARTFAAMNMQAAAFDMDEGPPALPPAAPAAQVATSKVESSGAATTYHIQRRTTIDSDNKEHKVTIAILSLASAFRHYSVPALNKVAYLQCLTTNTSDYTLLASASVNVFLDNSFIAKTELVNVAPGEKFRTFLGVDKAVKVEYRKLSNVHHERGYFSKTEDVTHKFITKVTNNKRMPIQMVVADMLPVSDDTAIKIKLIAPTKEEVEAGTAVETRREGAAATGGAAGAGGTGAGASMVTQVKATNNLVWTRPMGPGATVEIPFEYAVEHPGGRQVVTYKRAAGSL